MKKLFPGMIVILFSFPALAGNPPNDFVCSNKDGSVQVHYTTSSKAGLPTLNFVHVLEEIAVYAQGVDISTTDTVLGTLVSTPDTAHFIPDAKDSFVSIVIPTILNLPSKGSAKVTFDTVAIETTSRTTIGGPQLVVGPIETSIYIPVNCTARALEF